MKRLVMVFAVGVLAGSCTGPTPSSDGDAGGELQCGSCDDDAFCNGLERCEAGECVAGDPPCAPDETCDEASDACETRCAIADRDEDGDPAMECGGGDCDDGDPERASTLPETCDEAGVDEDCDTTTFGARDRDGDLAFDGSCCNGAVCGTDCDDTRSGVNPSSPEVCDTVDNDCDGAIDEELVSTCWIDADRDRYAAEGAASTRACECPVGTTLMPPDEGSTDCDDSVAATSPEGVEVCDSDDNDCDGMVDESLLVRCWADADRDGYAPAGASETMLCECGAGTTARAPADAADCDDGRFSVSPLGAEGCAANGLDDDCDGAVDDFGDDWYRDCDEDGYGVGTPIRACSDPGTPPACPGGGGGYARGSSGDCDDSSAAIRPGVPVVPELCDGRDNDCDPSTVDGRSETWFQASCDGADSDQCREGRFACGPGGAPMTCDDRVDDDVEACGGGDEDCDGAVDEASATNAWCDARLSSLPHATDATCTAGSCRATACELRYFDCNTAPGCESRCQWNGCAGTGCDDPVRVGAYYSSGGTGYACAIRTGGTMACWSGTTAATTPGLSNAMDFDGSCVLRADGSVARISGVGATPTPVAGVSNATQVSCYSSANCARRSDGTVVCFESSGAIGLLGNGSTSGSLGTVAGISDAVEVAAGTLHACALRANGTVWCWGLDNFGQLGDGVASHSTCMYGSEPYDCATTPVQVAGLTDAVEIESGYLHSCARRSNGAVVCWGLGNSLGDGLTSHGSCPGWLSGPTPDCARAPVPVLPAGAAVDLEMSGYGSGLCFERPSGVVACWGMNGVARDVEGIASPSDLGVLAGSSIVSVCAIDANGLRCGGVGIAPP